MADEKNAALNDLKLLIRKGFISREATIDNVIFTLSTLSSVDSLELAVESGCDGFPEESTAILKYMPLLLKRVVKKINGVEVTPEELDPIFKGASSAFLMKLVEEYFNIFKREREAQAELKNSSATPNPVFSGK